MGSCLQGEVSILAVCPYITHNTLILDLTDDFLRSRACSSAFSSLLPFASGDKSSSHWSVLLGVFPLQRLESLLPLSGLSPTGSPLLLLLLRLSSVTYLNMQSILSGDKHRGGGEQISCIKESITCRVQLGKVWLFFFLK